MQPVLRGFSDEELEITELPEREEMLNISLGAPPSISIMSDISILSLITL